MSRRGRSVGTGHSAVGRGGSRNFLLFRFCFVFVLFCFFFWGGGGGGVKTLVH